MKLPAAILLVLVTTPALAGAGGWGTAAPQQAAVKPAAPAPQPAEPWSPVDPPQKVTPNGINYLLPGMRLDPKTGYVDPKTVLDRPPAKYDFPFNGDLTVVTTSMAHVKQLCPPMQFGFPPIGCASHDVQRTYCKIVVARDAEIRAIGWSPEDNFRHEQAHCNGWPADHPGAR